MTPTNASAWLSFCERIAKEQDQQKFTRLVQELDDLLKAKERRLGILPPQSDKSLRVVMPLSGPANVSK